MSLVWRVVSLLLLISSYFLVKDTDGPVPAFTDVTRTAQVNFQQANSATSEKYLLETMGGGVAVFDYDNDGRMDLFFTNGAKLEVPMRAGSLPDKSEPKYWNRLYHQNADGSFTDLTSEAGLSGQLTQSYCMGVAVGDFDNDGYEDLYVTGYPRNILYHNNGDGTFKDITQSAGVGGGGWSASAGFLDYDNDGKLDLFVTRYLDWSFDRNLYCGDRRPGGRAYCHPNYFAPVTSILYRNNGDGTFSDVSRQAGITAAKGKGLGVAFADYDRDGWMDIYVANDSMQSFLWHNNRNGTFSERSIDTNVGYTEDGASVAGMGVDFSDFDNDGFPDLVVTDLSNESYRLYRNEGGASFRDVTMTSGLSAASVLYSGWGVKLIDYDNDGWKDLFVAQGHVLDTVAMTYSHLTYLQPPLLLRNLKGHFTRVLQEAGEPFRAVWAGRGAAFGDFNNDGSVDIAVANVGQSAYLLRNEIGARNHWIEFTLVGSRSNRDGIGARIKVISSSGMTQFYTVNTASSYLSASDKRVLAGLGADETAAVVEVRWPSGKMQRLENVKANQRLTIRE
ncbi:MAG: CRTAC1 family protein [Acidobacteriaceae bacterium]|nr:CRTAC1 family protein [Acidobacteriaceae bacterium]